MWWKDRHLSYSMRTTLWFPKYNYPKTNAMVSIFETTRAGDSLLRRIQHTVRYQPCSNNSRLFLFDFPDCGYLHDVSKFMGPQVNRAHVGNERVTPFIHYYASDSLDGSGRGIHRPNLEYQMPQFKSNYILSQDF